MEVRRCGVEGTVDGRKATAEERAEAKSIMTRMGYKIPNSDIPTVVEKDFEKQFLQVLGDVIVERFNVRPYQKETTQTKL
jgi:light-regulated signal transduction histidine kinase (bacteriophytochrome)